MKKNLLFLSGVLMTFLFLMQGVRSQTVVDIIANSADHDTLEAAIIAAGLDDDLAGAGPFTVFAPTDAAFKALPLNALDALLEDPEGFLTDLLLNHVVSGTLMSGDLTNGQVLTTLLDEDVTVTINYDGVFINNAMVTVVDLEADNGVVHVVDAVIIPSFNTVMDIIAFSPEHDTLEFALIFAELDDDLAGEGPFTVFAPTDDAFKLLPPGTVEALLPKIEGILLYHVAAGTVMSDDLSDEQVITTLNGKDVTVTINENGIFINDAEVIVADLIADNGVVHVIDAVLIPPVDEAAFPIDFETETDAVWEVFANGTGSASDFEVIANPDKSGDNTSDNVLKFVVNADADPWAGAFSDSYAPVEFTQSNHKITLMVWKSVISPVAFKVEASSNGGPVTEVKVSNTVTNAWELLTFNMSACIGYSYNRIVILPDFPEARTAGTTAYIDNIERKVEATGILNLDEDSKSLTIYPNPAADHIRLSGLGELKEGMMRIITTGGVEVVNRYVKDLSGTIDVSRLDQGAYFLILESGSNRYTGKLFKK